MAKHWEVEVTERLGVDPIHAQLLPLSQTNTSSQEPTCSSPAPGTLPSKPGPGQERDPKHFLEGQGVFAWGDCPSLVLLSNDCCGCREGHRARCAADMVGTIYGDVATNGLISLLTPISSVPEGVGPVGKDICSRPHHSRAPSLPEEDTGRGGRDTNPLCTHPVMSAHSDLAKREREAQRGHGICQGHCWAVGAAVYHSLQRPWPSPAASQAGGGLN